MAASALLQGGSRVTAVKKMGRERACSRLLGVASMMGAALVISLYATGLPARARGKGRVLSDDSL